MRRLLLLALAASSTGAAAGDFYAGAGLPGVFVGYAQAIGDSIVVRTDVATIGTLNRSRLHDGLDYDGRLKANRVGVFVDSFLTRGFRLTGGLTLNDARLDLAGRGDGGTIRIGNQTYVAGPDDRFDVSARFPRAMPYIGLGHGRHPSGATGWSVVFDLGLSIGKPKVTGQASGPLLTNTVAQSDIEQQLQKFRDDASNVIGIPQVSLAVSYRF